MLRSGISILWGAKIAESALPFYIKLRLKKKKKKLCLGAFRDGEMIRLGVKSRCTPHDAFPHDINCLMYAKPWVSEGLRS